MENIKVITTYHEEGDSYKIVRLLDEIAQAEAEVRELMNGMTEEEKKSLLNDMDDAMYERWD